MDIPQYSKMFHLPVIVLVTFQIFFFPYIFAYQVMTGLPYLYTFYKIYILVAPAQ